MEGEQEAKEGEVWKVVGQEARGGEEARGRLEVRPGVGQKSLISEPRSSLGQTLCC